MGYPLREQRPGSIYLVRCDGVNGTQIFRGALDRSEFRATLAEVAGRFRWRVHELRLDEAWYELVVEIRAPNLARGMQHLNSLYARRFNRRHGRFGHLFARRYESRRIGAGGLRAALRRLLRRVRALVARVRTKSDLTSDASPRPSV